MRVTRSTSTASVGVNLSKIGVVELAVGAEVFVVGDMMLVGGEAMFEGVAGYLGLSGFGFRAMGFVAVLASDLGPLFGSSGGVGPWHGSRVKRCQRSGRGKWMNRWGIFWWMWGYGHTESGMGVMGREQWEADFRIGVIPRQL
jgi:hypothetical protein